MNDVRKVPRRYKPNDNKKKKRRKKNMSLYYFMTFFFVSLILLILSLTVLFKIDAISVEGDTIYSADEIISTGKIYAGENLIRLPDEKITENILKNLRYIDEAKIKKKLPGTVIVNVTPAKQYLNIRHGNNYIIISEKGRILESDFPQPGSGLLTFSGFDVQNTAAGEFITSSEEQQLQLLFSLADAVYSSEINGITNIDITDRYDITFDYENRVTVYLGNSGEITEKLAAVKVILETKIGSNETGNLIANDPMEIFFRQKYDGNTSAPEEITVHDSTDISAEETTTEG